VISISEEGTRVVRRFVVAACAVTLLAAAGCGGNDRPAAEASPSPVVTTAPTEASPSPSASASPTVAAPTAAFEVKGYKVVAGPRTVQVKLGTEVVLEVLSDADDELHVHGYEKKAKVTPGSPTRVSFAATIPGVFEVELHSGVKLCDLRVQ
jgi:hypothetical protein